MVRFFLLSPRFWLQAIFNSHCSQKRFFADLNEKRKRLQRALTRKKQVEQDELRGDSTASATSFDLEQQPRLAKVMKIPDLLAIGVGATIGAGSSSFRLL